VDGQQRIERLCGTATYQIAGRPTGRPTYAAVCSRLGRGLSARRRTFEYLQRAILRAKRDDAELLIVPGTAPEAWVRRGAELFDVPVREVTVAAPAERDAVLVALADRVVAVWVRRGGKIATLVAQRLRLCADDSTWVAVNEDSACAASELIDQGAVGWYLRDAAPQTSSACDLIAARPAQPSNDVSNAPQARVLLSADAMDWSEYLVHCTRGRQGPLPGQTDTQYRDEVLLGGEGGQPATAIETLQAILRSGWLLGSSRVTRAETPVVCWSAVPLPELLRRRTFRPHLGRWDYEPFGIAIRRTLAARLRLLPVLYGTAADHDRLAPEDRWRFQAIGKRINWRAEQEWRCRGGLDLSQIGDNDAVVFAHSPQALPALQRLSRWPVVDVDTFLCVGERVQ